VSEKIPRCPFCDEIVYATGGGTARCLTEGCPMQEADVKLFIEQWTRRPREDQLVKLLREARQHLETDQSETWPVMEAIDAALKEET